ncbi:ketosynthase [Alkalilimnicola sp. S0819]|uniref:ketosynthase n=1 Tax=Alkalilimnicola sp. S0819 TaxID=2613922 RepID=UPI001261CE07|nr:ketosynthase [Alkalilimnicola sp. S0819]KAB7624176.1 ketosynthase [Alkalilimnicola sp. S0819]MPQ16430.1 ketosynthase [Alkalilimnicola sp. S0819]
MRLLIVLAAYSLSVHLSVALERPGIALGVLSLLLIVGLRPLLRKPSWAAWLSLAAWLLAAGALLQLDRGQLLLYGPPVLYPLAAVIFFGRSLLPGRTALLTRIAELMHDDLTPRRRWYTRRATQAWTLFFAALGLEAVLLGLFAPPRIWSLFTNLINYLLIAGFFLGEFLVRRRHFEDQRRLGLSGFIRALARVDMREV